MADINQADITAAQQFDRDYEVCRDDWERDELAKAFAAHRLSAKLEAEREIIEWVRRDLGGEAMRLMLAAGIPGGTRTQRTKNAAFAEGVSHAVSALARHLEHRIEK